MKQDEVSENGVFGTFDFRKKPSAFGVGGGGGGASSPDPH